MGLEGADECDGSKIIINIHMICLLEIESNAPVRTEFGARWRTSTVSS